MSQSSESPTHAKLYDMPDPYSVALPEQITHVMVVSVGTILFGLIGMATLPFLVQPMIADISGIRGGVYGAHDAITLWGIFAPIAGTGLAAAALVAGAAAMRFNSWARIVLLFFAVLEILKGLAGIYFHLEIIRLVTNGYAIPTFGFRLTAMPEWVDWLVGGLLGIYTLYVMMLPEVKIAFARKRAVG